MSTENINRVPTHLIFFCLFDNFLTIFGREILLVNSSSCGTATRKKEDWKSRFSKPMFVVVVVVVVDKSINFFNVRGKTSLFSVGTLI